MKTSKEACINNYGCMTKDNRFLSSVKRVFKVRLSALNPLPIINRWRQRQKHRSHLMELPDYLLEDIGLSRDQVQTEYEKPFWKEGIF